MEIVLAALGIWLCFVAFGAFMAMPGKFWVFLVLAIAGFAIMARADACEEHKPPYCWQQADGQIFCENQ